MLWVRAALGSRPRSGRCSSAARTLPSFKSVHILGPRAGDLIAEAVAAIEFGASSEDLARTSIFLPYTTIGLARGARQSTPPQLGPGRRLFVPQTAHYNRSQRTRAADQPHSRHSGGGFV